MFKFLTISSVIIIILVFIQQNNELNKQSKLNKKRVRFSDKVEIYRY